MGAAQNRQLLAEVEKIATSFEWKAQSVASKRVKQTAHWVWNQLNELWYILFYANVVRRVGPNEPEVVVRNSFDELRYRY